MGSRSAQLWLAARAPAPRLGKALGRPLAPAAFRVPRRGAALVFPSHSPQIFVHEGARQALERRLLAAFEGSVILSITDNRHSMISHSTERGILHVRIHHMFLDAPPTVLDMLVQYLTRGDREASVGVGQFIEDARSRIVRPTPRSSLHTKGKAHDLLTIFDELNARYFGAAVTALITWGQRRGRRGPRTGGKTGERGMGARSTIKLGSYSATERLIRVHPALDRAWVPRYFVAYIVYHEMLHHVLPAARTGANRRVLHPPAFLDRERAFRHFERAIAWEKRHLGRLLRS
jgi:hypothetical protein